MLVYQRVSIRWLGSFNHEKMCAATLTKNVESAELYNYSTHRDFTIKREGCEEFTINTEDLNIT